MTRHAQCMCGQLRVAWTFSVGSNHGQEAAPIVVGDTMYVVGAYPNELFALDSVTGDLKWKYSPRVDPSSQGVACCDVVNRGEVYDNGKIFFNTLDNHTIAVDAKTGKEVWAIKLGEITRGSTLTMAPLAVKGKILVGNSGGEMGVRGWVTAVDENSGKIVWRNQDGHYRIDGSASVLFFTLLQFSSDGVLDGYGVSPALYTEKRFRKSPTAAGGRRSRARRSRASSWPRWTTAG